MDQYQEFMEAPSSPDGWSISMEYVMEKLFCPEGIYPDPEPPVTTSSPLETPPSEEQDQESAVCCPLSFSVPHGMLHPLQNPLILMNMFNLCPPTLLANFRLVCKSWRDLSLTPWRSTAFVTFRLTAGSIIVVGKKFFPFDQYLQNYLDNPRNLTDRKPIRSMRLLSWHYDASLEHLKRFWDTLGNNMTTLELNRCVFTNNDEFQRIIFKYCPNLKQLRLIRCIYQFSRTPPPLGPSIRPRYQEPQYGIHPQVRSLHIEAEMHKGFHQCPVTWLEILTHFQNLTSIYYFVQQKCCSEVEAENAEYDCHSLLRAIGTVRGHDKRKLPLKSVNILPLLDVNPTYSTIDMLSDLNLPMQTSGVCFHLEPETNPELSEEILKLFAPELKQFQVVIKADVQVPMYWEFPKIGTSLEQLTMLTLRNVICEKMGFLAGMPNLETLHMTNDLAPGLINVPLTEVAQTKLLKMREFTCDYLLTYLNIMDIVQLMPNVEILEMALRNCHFQLICYYWRKLKGLKVIGDFLGDEGVTGRINREIQVDLGKEVLPGITLLQDLEYCSFNRNDRLTDATAQHGLFHLPNLRRVQICPHPEFSEEVRKEFWQRDIKLLGVNGNLNGES